MADPADFDILTFVWRVLFMAGCSALSVGVGIWRLRAVERADRELFGEKVPFSDVERGNTHYVSIVVGCIHVLAGTAAVVTLLTPTGLPIERVDRSLVRFAEVVSSGPAVLCGLFTVWVVIDGFLYPSALELRRKLDRYRDEHRRRK